MPSNTLIQSDFMPVAAHSGIPTGRPARRIAWETLADLGLTEHEIVQYFGVSASEMLHEAAASMRSEEHLGKM